MTLQKYKKRQIYIQYLYRIKYFYNFFFFKVLKFLAITDYKNKQINALILFYLANLNLNKFKTRHKNVCLETGHKRGVLNFFKMNRMSIIKNLDNLKFPGVKSAIW